MAWLNPFANPTKPVVPSPSPGTRHNNVGGPSIFSNNVFTHPAPATPRLVAKRARGPGPTPLSRRLVLHETPGRRAQDEIEESDGEGDLDLPLADSPSTPVPPAPGQWSGQTPGQCSTPMPASTSGGAKTSLALAPPPSRSALVSGLQLSEAKG